MEYVVDTQVVLDSVDCLNCFETLQSISKNHTLVLDTENLILNEYYHKLRKDSFTQKVLKRIFLEQRVQYYSSTVTPKIREALERLSGFHNDDHKFVAVTARSIDKALIAEESDYSETVCSSLKADLCIDVIDCLEYLKRGGSACHS